MNSLFAINPYKWNGLWVFDDERVGLDKEALVGGTDEMIDVATAHIPNAAKGFVAIFSHQPFPGAHIVLQWRREEMGGNVYYWPEKNLEGWLCPALFKYFPSAPKELHIQVREAPLG